MDYAFAPGVTGQDKRVRHLFRRRSQTTLIGREKTRSTVRQFINHLATHSSIARPVDDLLIGAHANDEGFLFIPMFPGQKGATIFETLEQTIADSTKSIAVPDATTGHTAGDPVTHSFHIKGCNIGKSRPFLVKLKEALGGNLNVSAPKHFHFLYSHSAYGVWESMDYEFTILRSSPFPSRAAALSAFQTNTNFTRIDGSSIPPADWDSWIPRSISRTRSVEIRGSLGVTIGSRSTIPVEREFRYRKPSPKNNYIYSVLYQSASSVPDSPAERERHLEQSLGDNERFNSTRNFPEYERWGYSSLSEFFHGHKWSFEKKGKRLICIGKRHAYTMIVPITDPSSGNLIFNFYPNSASPHPPIRTGLVISDAQFFERV